MIECYVTIALVPAIQTISGGAAKLKNFRKALERNDFFVFPSSGLLSRKYFENTDIYLSNFQNEVLLQRGYIGIRSVSFRRKLLIENLFKSFGWYRFSKLSLYFSILISYQHENSLTWRPLQIEIRKTSNERLMQEH